VRYLGYTNEFGEAFRSFIPKSLVTASYIVASGKMPLSETVKSSKLIRVAPTAAGLILIPFLPILLDYPIDLALDKTIRPVLDKFFKE